MFSPKESCCLPMGNTVARQVCLFLYLGPTIILFREKLWGTMLLGNKNVGVGTLKTSCFFLVSFWQSATGSRHGGWEHGKGQIRASSDEPNQQWHKLACVPCSRPRVMLLGGTPSESPTAPTWLSLEVEQKPMGMAGSGRPRKGGKKNQGTSQHPMWVVLLQS